MLYLPPMLRIAVMMKMMTPKTNPIRNLKLLKSMHS